MASRVAMAMRITPCSCLATAVTACYGLCPIGAAYKRSLNGAVDKERLSARYVAMAVYGPLISPWHFVKKLPHPRANRLLAQATDGRN